MKIQPLDTIVFLKIEEAKAGVLDTSSRGTAVEYAEVIAVGDKVSKIAAGDHVFVKSWAIDIISYQDKKYHFCNTETKGILAIVK